MPLPVYLVHWHQPEWCASAALSVGRSVPPVALTVIDNSGDFESAVRTLRPNINGGFSGGANVGLREWLTGDAPYCVIAAHDLHVESDTFMRLVEAAEANPDFGVLGTAFSPAGIHGELLNGGNEQVEQRTMVSGACMLLRRSCIEDIGQFDEEFGTYTEDRELCLRAADHGWKVGRVLAARSSGLGRGSPDASVLWRANHVLLARKRGGRLSAVGKLGQEGAWLIRHLAQSLGRSDRARAHRRMVGIRGRVIHLACRKLHEHERRRTTLRSAVPQRRSRDRR